MNKKVAILVTLIALSIIFAIYFFFFRESGYKFTSYKDNIKMEVFGTEYIPMQNGRVFVQLVNMNTGDYINNSVCYILLVSPYLQVIANTVMNYYDRGLYYYDFIVPPEDGVYMIDVRCTMPYGIREYTASNYNTIGTAVTGYLGQTKEVDQDYFVITGRNGNAIEFTFPNVSLENYTDFFVQIYGYFTSANTNYYLNVYAYNYCTKSYEYLGRAIYYSLLNTFILNSCHNPPLIRLAFPNIIGSTTNYRLDMIKVLTVYQVASVVTNIRGGGEVHVTGIEKMGQNPSIRILT